MPSPSVELDSFVTFGDALKYLRRRERLTQLELSIAVGYSEAQISRLEKNQRLPDLTAIKALFVPALHLEQAPGLTTQLFCLAESARQEDAPLPGVAPYKGLLFFDEADSDLFFGREALTAHLVERVNQLASGRPRLLAIIGASGSGKSSVARAGLAVALKRMGWDTRVFTPTAQPLKMLEPSLAYDPANAKPILRIVDQFEEVFTLCREETTRAEFIGKLIDVADTPTQTIAVVIVLRADFYAHCAYYPRLRQAIAAQQEYIGHMTPGELRRAIEEPARQNSWEFEPGLVDLILHDIGAGATHDQEPGALPLLSHALLATWEHRRGRTFTLEGYRASGGVRGAIAETAESVYTDQFDQGQQRFVRDIFLRLTELGEGTEDTRRRATLTELVPRADEATQLRAILNTLADARLVMLGEDSVEVAHEALIREWSRLREWLNENREGLRLHRHLTESAQSWDKLQRDAGELYRGARLAQALEWAKTDGDSLNPLESEFLEACRQFAEHEAKAIEAQRQRDLGAAQKLAETERQRAEAERQRAEESGRAAVKLRRRALFLVGALIIAALLAGSSAIFAQQSNQNSERAENERRTAFARELSVNAVNNLDVDPERSILLALQAVSVGAADGKPVLREAEESLHRAVISSRVQLTLRGHTGTLQGIVYSPDGKRLATASNDGTAKVWDAATGKELLTLVGHSAQVKDVAFSPDGTRLATASSDQTAKVWDATTGKELFTLRGHNDQVLKVAYSADGRRLITAAGRPGSAPSDDHTAKVWDAATGQLLLTLDRASGSVRGIAFSPDGTRVVSANDEGTAEVRDAMTGQVLLTLTGHTGVVYDAVFSPDGRRLATGGADNTIKVWDATSGRMLLTLLGHGSNVWTVAFNRDGTRLYSASLDGTAKAWNADTGQLLLTLVGHTGGLRGLAISPDGTRLATASDDNTAKVWDVTPTGGREWLTLAAHTSTIYGAVFSPDGKRIATASSDKTAKVWDAGTGQELLTFTGHGDALRNIAYSPDARRLVTSSWDKTAKIWDAATGHVFLTLSTQATPYVQSNDVVFSPDGQRIAAASAGNTAKIWDANSGKELLTLSGHTSMVLRLAFSPDGKRIATASETPDQTAKVWDAATGQELLTLKGHVGGVYSVAFSPDGTRLATVSSDGTAKLWDATSGKELFTFSGHTAQVNGLAITPDGKRLATASADGTTKVWEIPSEGGQTEQPLSLYSGNSRTVAFSPDGRRLLTGGSDGILRIYALPIEDIVGIAKSRLTRTLTIDECQKFLHVESCPAPP